MAPADAGKKECHGPMAVGPTSFRIETAGCAVTVNEALVVLPFTVTVLITWETVTPVLSYVVKLAVGAVTFTVTVQDPPAASVPPVRRIPGSPMPRAPLLLSNNDPPQVFVVVSGEATVILAGEVGKVSVKATPLKAFAGLGLVIKNVRVDVPLGPIVLGENAFEICGGRTAFKLAAA